MGKAMIRMHVLRELAGVYDQWRQTHSRFFGPDSDEVTPVPVKLLKMAHEIIEEQDKVKKEI